MIALSSDELAAILARIARLERLLAIYHGPQMGENDSDELLAIVAELDRGVS